jgi:hypothetical protein
MGLDYAGAACENTLILYRSQPLTAPAPAPTHRHTLDAAAHRAL